MLLLLLLVGELTTGLDHSTPLSLPPPPAPWIARTNLQLHQSSTRLTAPHTVALSPSCFLSSVFLAGSLCVARALSLSRTHTHTHTICVCFALSPGSAQTQHHHSCRGDSSDGKTEGFFLSSPGVPPRLPSPPLPSPHPAPRSASLSLSVFFWSVDHTDVPNHIQAVWL